MNLILILSAVLVLQQALDFYTTWRVLSLGGKENTALIRWLIAKCGLFMALVISKGGIAALVWWAVWLNWPGTLFLAWVLAGSVAYYVYILSGNFDALREQKEIAARSAP